MPRRPLNWIAPAWREDMEIPHVVHHWSFNESMRTRAQSRKAPMSQTTALDLLTILQNNAPSAQN